MADSVGPLRILGKLAYDKLADLLIPFVDDGHRDEVIYEFVTKGSLADIDALLLHHPCHNEVLFEACIHNRTDIFDHLVDMGIKPDSQCLQVALLNHQQAIPIIDKILALGVIPEPEALWEACLIGNLTLVNRFILHGTDINKEGVYNPFVMTMLIERNCADIVLLFLSMCNQINNYEELMVTAMETKNKINSCLLPDDIEAKLQNNNQLIIDALKAK